MIIDITGTAIIPGNYGRDCPGSGEVPGVECCCEECDYLLCCTEQTDCALCTDRNCPRNKKAAAKSSP